MSAPSSPVLSTADLSAAKKALLEKRLQGAARRPAGESSIRRTPRPEHLPLSYAQQRLWFLDQLAPGNPVYNIFQALRIKGPLNVPVLEASLAEIVRRHEALRTTFGIVDGQPVQVIHKEATLKLSEIDLRPLPPQKQEESAQRLASEEAARPFDLTRDLMVRATLLHLDGEEHILIVTMHHIASDGWSIGVLFRELGELYNAAVQGKTVQLPGLPIQYADYALWQREWLTGPVLEKQLAYWKEQLTGAPEILELPTDRARPAVQTFRGAAQIVTLPLAVARSLSSLSRQEGVTLYMTLLSAFSTLLHRYTRQSDIVIGSPIAGRTQTATEGLIGFFINTLALRTDLSGNPTFRELLQRVRKTTLDAYAHQDVPFDKLVVELQPERSTSHTPLFQVMFALQSAPTQPLDLSGLTILPMEIDNGTAKFDLTLAISEAEHGLVLDLEYNQDLFEGSTISRMLGHFQTLLEGIVAHPEQRIAELPIMTPTERHQLLVEWNETQVDYPRNTPVHVLFERQVQATPEAIALQYERQLLTYRELNTRANQLAHYLAGAGVQPEACVGVYLERTPELFVALLAILKAGAAYLPLDRTYPKDRIAFMLEDAQVPLLLSEERFAAELPASATRVVYLDREAKEIARHDKTNPVNRVTGESLAYVIYTSGSTGRPKGACIPHRAINRLVINSDYVQFGPDQVIAQASNASFDAATFEIWGAFLNGGRLVIMTKDVVLSPKEFAEQLKKQRITSLFLTTSLFNLMAREVPGAFATLTNVLYGGEAADPRWVAEILNHQPPKRLVNIYGPTETTTFAAWYCSDKIPENARSIPIGRPLANTRLYVLDEHLQPVPIGVPGELYIGGGGVGRGYLNRAELTADRFIPDRFSLNPQDLLYKTGDLVRYLPDGNIEFLGRIDLQVKIRGFRIEIGEVETLLSQHPAIRECAVTVREDHPGDKRLVAYFVPHPESNLTVDTLRDYLKQRLPEYMVPAAFVRLVSLPINPNGKVSRRALPAPDPASGDAQAEKVAARDTIEERLVGIWESVLNVRPVGIQDRFFHLGGHSLLAVKLVSEIEKSFGRKLAVSSVFRAPTIEQLASILRGGELAAPSSAIVDIQPHGTKPPLFLVHGVGGGMFWGYQNLSRHLGNDQPVFVIRSRAMDGEGREEFRHIEEMAAQYVAELRAVQPKGPYYLGGYCFGGNVAYEMSRQLVGQGEKVAFLGLMNCAPPNSSYTRFRWSPDVLLKFVANVGLWVGNIWHWTPQQRRDFVRWKLRTARSRVAALFRKASGGEQNGVDEVVDLSAHTVEQRKLWATHVQALIDYHPSPFPGQVTLYRSKVHQFLCSFDSACGWRELAQGGVTVKVVPGPHEGILEEPHVRAVAREVKASLEAAQKEAGPPPEPPTRPKIEPLPLPAGQPPKRESAALSLAQQQVWHALDLGFEHELGTNVFKCLRLQGDLDVAALESSVAAVLRRHEELRVRFAVEDGQPVKKSAPELQAALEIVDSTGLALPGEAGAMEQLVAPYVSRPFNITEGPLHRWVLIRLTPTEHLFIVAFHPLVADEASVELVLADMAAFYGRNLGGEPGRWSDASPTPASAGEPKESLVEHVAYWRNRPDEPSTKIELLMDTPRPAQQTGVRRVEFADLPAKLFYALRQFSQREGVAMSLVLLAAFGVLVGRAVRDEYLPVRAKLSHRGRPHVPNVVGRFTEAVDVAIELSPRSTVLEMLRNLQTALENVLEHVRIPFCKMAGELFAGLDTPRPVPRLGFEFIECPQPKTRFGSVSATPLRVALPGSPLALRLRILGGEGQMQMELEYETDHFEAETARRLLRRLEAILGAMTELPSQARVADLPRMTAVESEQVLVEWNATAADFPFSRTWAQLFEERAALLPEGVAARCGAEALSYRELNERGGRLAAQLQMLGARPGQIVAVALQRSLDLAVAIVGIQKARAVYLPLELASPRERLAEVLSDAAPALILAHRKFATRLPEASARIVWLDEPPELPEAGAHLEPAVGQPQDVAYVLYTSGSTGKPKGVQICQRSLVNHNCAVARTFNLTERDRVLQFSSLSFDISIEEIFPTWLAGGTVVFRPDDVLSSLHRFLEFVENEQITVLDIPTAFWHEVVDFLPLRSLPECVRLVVIGGERAAQRSFEAWKRHVGTRVRLINTYGPTEGTVIATMFEPGGDDGRLPIGRPIANTTVYVLDEEMQPCPMGMAGELYIGGAGVAAGYLNSPELTQSRFLANPFNGGKDRLYKTGDLVRWRADGNLEFIGRVDQQIKVRGFRVEPGEIEAALASHPAVAECVVLPSEDGRGLLTGYFAPLASLRPDPAEVLTFLRGKLPDYMVPARLVPVEALPRNVRGKIDRDALAALDTARAETGPLEMPRNDVEARIAGIWCEVLGLDKVGIDENFFRLGGHSLHAMQVTSRLQSIFGEEVPASELFDHPTVAGLALTIFGLRRRRGNRAGPIQKISRRESIPLSFAQQRLWFLQQLDPSSPAYNIPQAVRLQGPLDMDVLRDSLSALVRRHEALRTVFLTIDGKPAQTVMPPGRVALPVLDLSGGTEGDIQRHMVEEARKPFDLSRDPMLRPLLLRRGEHEHILLLTIHHIAADAWSIGVMMEELAALYSRTALPELSIQYADFAMWQRGWLDGATLEDQLQYWKEKLSGAPALLELPADRPRPSVQSTLGARQKVSLDSELVGKLRRLAEGENCTLFMALLAAFQALLMRYTGREDIVIGCPTANRTRPDLERLIGFFVNTLVLRTDATGQPTFRQLLLKTRETALGAFGHQDVPFEMLVDELHPARDPSFHPLFQVMFVLQNAPLPAARAKDLAWQPFDVDIGSSKFDLTLELSETDHGVEGWFEYSTDLFDAWRIERLAAHFQTLAAAIADQPDQSVALLRLLTPEDETRLCEEWRGPAEKVSADKCIHHLFEAQALRTPDQVAVVFHESALTYKELNRRADHLAHLLRSMDVGPDVLVGLCMERSLEMIVAILGILKAGGAYVPMDPAYPQDRVAFMMEDARTSVLITQQRLLSRLPGAVTQVVCLDDSRPEVISKLGPALSAASTTVKRPRPENLAYVIYTSGSTGKPKGVAVEHRSVVAFLHWARRAFSPEELNGVLFVTSICFDLSIFEMFAPLSWGGKVVLADNALEWPRMPAARQVTLVNTVPSLAAEWLRNADLPDGVQTINLAGEPLSQALVEDIHRRWPHVRTVNDLYGPTETTVYSTGSRRGPGGQATIGRPLSNEQVYLLDRNRQLAPIGVPGELYIGGAGLAREYLRRPDLTAEKFVENPFEAGTRLYRTGDLARYRPDGTLEYLGRMDHQVKIRGYRIELGEIEERLREHGQIREAVVVASPSPSGEKRLVAYVVAGDGATPETSELRAHLKRDLPEYMVPSVFVMLETLPLTPNGKVDRKALPAPGDSRGLSHAHVPPASMTEKLLAEIWSSVLGVQNVGVTDNFFELGGHSLLITKVLARLREAIDLDVPMRAMFEAPTIAELARVVESMLLEEVDQLSDDEAERLDAGTESAETVEEARS